MAFLVFNFMANNISKQEINIIAENLGIKAHQVENTISLIEEGATIPFISRYRKELTGNLDEVKISEIQDEYIRLQNVAKRKETILKTISEQNKLTKELQNKINNCFDINELEDIYLPYKQKRKTKASIAIENGLEPLANIIMKQNDHSPELAAKNFLNKNIKTTDEALEGAKYIISERINDNSTIRKIIRQMFDKYAVIISKLIKTKEEEALKYKDYFDWEEKLNKIPSHRLLAILRAKDEGFLRVKIKIDDDYAIDRLKRFFIKNNTESAKLFEEIIKYAYKKYLAASLENEFFKKAKQKADNEAIEVFSENLKQLLLLPPLGQKRILAIDPGYRTGCKIVCLSETGDLLTNVTIYPHPPQNEYKQAQKRLASLVSQYKIEAIAIGNGTAGRETERLVKNTKFDRQIKAFVVSEAGASVYSASAIAREEFPQYDVTVRGAVSIGRRLIDPLAELVKIDPKSIGVGQYQHDVDQKLLKDKLNFVVEYCVNSVGVDVNTASKYLLKYVSGIGDKLAQNIIDYRSKNGAFNSRDELKKVSGMGEKAFEQAAGFIKVRNSENPLDNTSVHPESYHIVYKIAEDLKINLHELIENKELIEKIDWRKYANDKVGELTLNDIKNELLKPGRDPRKNISVFEFADIHTINDIKPGDVLPGIVGNITNFGAFVDIGIKQNGLIHISNMADEFVSDPHKILKLHQQIKVEVLSVDIERNRIQLKLLQKN